MKKTKLTKILRSLAVGVISIGMISTIPIIATSCSDNVEIVGESKVVAPRTGSKYLVRYERTGPEENYDETKEIVYTEWSTNNENFKFERSQGVASGATMIVPGELKQETYNVTITAKVYITNKIPDKDEQLDKYLKYTCSKNIEITLESLTNVEVISDALLKDENVILTKPLNEDINMHSGFIKFILTPYVDLHKIFNAELLSVNLVNKIPGISIKLENDLKAAQLNDIFSIKVSVSNECSITTEPLNLVIDISYDNKVIFKTSNNLTISNEIIPQINFNTGKNKSTLSFFGRPEENKIITDWKFELDKNNCFEANIVPDKTFIWFESLYWRSPETGYDNAFTGAQENLKFEKRFTNIPSIDQKAKCNTDGSFKIDGIDLVVGSSYPRYRPKDSEYGAVGDWYLLKTTIEFEISYKEKETDTEYKIRKVSFNEGFYSLYKGPVENPTDFWC